MYENPEDMFLEIDKLFASLIVRMIHDRESGEPQEFSCHMIIRHGAESSAKPALSRNQVRAISAPVVEIYRIDDEVKVITGLPGATMDAIELRLKGFTLSIDVDRDSLQYHTHTCLPPVDPGSMETSFKNGVLEVTFKILTNSSENKGS